MHPGFRLLLSIAVVGCDSQFSPHYQGESLLTVTGSVEITHSYTDGRLIPALAFSNQEYGQVDIVEVTVQGEFPSDFRIDVYQPPPPDTFFEASHQKGEPRAAVGYITAVSSDHPETIRYATNQFVQASMGCLNEDCTKTCETEGVECKVLTTEWCRDDGVTCYREIMFCPTLEAWTPGCRVEGTGDPAVKTEPWRDFAGFSQNYLVAYFEKAAPAGSWTAAYFGSPSGLPAGYSLFAMHAKTDDEQQADAECVQRAEVLAAEKYNADHGTSFSRFGHGACMFGAPSAPGAPDTGTPLPSLPEFCAGTNEELDVWDDQLARYNEQSKLELGCATSAFVLMRVVAPKSEPVSVRIGSDVNQFETR
jgi:hypothetical protein